MAIITEVKMDYINIITWLVTGASAITMMTNTPKDDGVIRKLYAIIEFFALVNDKVKQK